MASDTLYSEMGAFAVTPHALVDDEELGDRAIGCYVTLMRHAVAGQWTAFPGIARLSRILRCGRDRVIASIKELEAAGWLDVSRQQGEVNQYRLFVQKESVHTAVPKGPVGSADGGSRNIRRVPVGSADSKKNHLRRTNEEGAPSGYAAFMEIWNRELGKSYRVLSSETWCLKKIVGELALEEAPAAVRSFLTDKRYQKKARSLREFYFAMGEVVNGKSARDERLKERCPKCGSGSAKFVGGSQRECITCGHHYNAGAAA